MRHQGQNNIRPKINNGNNKSSRYSSSKMMPTPSSPPSSLRHGPISSIGDSNPRAGAVHCRETGAGGGDLSTSATVAARSKTASLPSREERSASNVMGPFSSPSHRHRCQGQDGNRGNSANSDFANDHRHVHSTSGFLTHDHHMMQVALGTPKNQAAEVGHSGVDRLSSSDHGVLDSPTHYDHGIMPSLYSMTGDVAGVAEVGRRVESHRSSSRCDFSYHHREREEGNPNYLAGLSVSDHGLCSDSHVLRRHVNFGGHRHVDFGGHRNSDPQGRNQPMKTPENEEDQIIVEPPQSIRVEGGSNSFDRTRQCQESITSLRTLDVRSYKSLKDALLKVKLFLDQARLTLQKTGGDGAARSTCTPLLATIITGNEDNGAVLKLILKKILRSQNIDFVESADGESLEVEVDTMSGIRDNGNDEDSCDGARLLLRQNDIAAAGHDSKTLAAHQDAHQKPTNGIPVPPLDRPIVPNSTVSKPGGVSWMSPLTTLPLQAKMPNADHVEQDVIAETLLRRRDVVLPANARQEQPPNHSLGTLSNRFDSVNTQALLMRGDISENDAPPRDPPRNNASKTIAAHQDAHQKPTNGIPVPPLDRPIIPNSTVSQPGGVSWMSPFTTLPLRAKMPNAHHVEQAANARQEQPPNHSLGTLSNRFDSVNTQSLLMRGDVSENDGPPSEPPRNDVYYNSALGNVPVDSSHNLMSQQQQHSPMISPSLGARLAHDVPPSHPPRTNIYYNSSLDNVPVDGPHNLRSQQQHSSMISPNLGARLAHDNKDRHNNANQHQHIHPDLPIPMSVLAPSQEATAVQDALNYAAVLARSSTVSSDITASTYQKDHSALPRPMHMLALSPEETDGHPSMLGRARPLPVGSNITSGNNIIPRAPPQQQEVPRNTAHNASQDPSTVYRSNNDEEEEIHRAIMESQAAHIAHTRHQVAKDIQFRKALQWASDESTKMLPLEAGGAAGSPGIQEEDEELLRIAYSRSILDERVRRQEAEQKYESELELALQQSQLKREEERRTRESEHEVLRMALVQSRADEEKHENEVEVLKRAMRESTRDELNLDENEHRQLYHECEQRTSAENLLQVLKLSLEEKERSAKEEEEQMRLALERSMMDSTRYEQGILFRGVSNSSIPSIG